MAIRISIFLLAGILLALVLTPKWNVKNNVYNLTAEEISYLKTDGDSALQKSDVPVASFLKYEGKILSRGYNTVRRNNHIAEHAEINAINRAINMLGIDSFNHLDRSKLYLVTTYEPCKMCEGVIIDNYIKHVIVVQNKSMVDWYKVWKMRMLYQWYKQTTNADTLQEYMFERNPVYKKLKSNNK